MSAAPAPAPALVDMHPIVGCIQPLLLSKVLPHDIVVQEIFAKHLYKQTSCLTCHQKQSIQQHHFYFKKLLMLYYNTYDRRIGSDSYFLQVFENDLCLALNNGKYFAYEKSAYLMANPELVKLCMTTVDDKNLPDFIYSVWCYLFAEKKLDVYEFLTTKFFTTTI